METTNLTLSIIIVAYNSAFDLRKCLKSIEKFSNSIEYEVIVVDNASVDSTVRVVKNAFPKAKLIENSENYGYAKAINQGVKLAKGKYIAIINPDVELQSNIFLPVFKLYENLEKIGCVGVKQINNSGQLKKSSFLYPSLFRRVLTLTKISKLLGPRSLFFRLYTPAPDSEEIVYVDAVGGAFLVLKRNLFYKVGGFDENFFLYHEDLDFCYRLKCSGYNIMLYSGDHIIHTGSHEETPANSFVFLQRNRSLLYYFKKHYSKSKFLSLAVMNMIFFGLRYVFWFWKMEYRNIYARAIKLTLKSLTGLNEDLRSSLKL